MSVLEGGNVGLVGAWSNTHARFDNFKITWYEPGDIEEGRKYIESEGKLTTIWRKIKSLG